MTEGGCLCGAVRVRAASVSDRIQACHCVQCQRWTGGGPLWSVRVEALAVEDEAPVRAYRASDFGERAFCGTCGSTLWWRMQGKPVVYAAAGLFAGRDGLSVGAEIFVDHRPSWMAPFEGAAQSTEAEELAALHAYLEKERGADA